MHLATRSGHCEVAQALPQSALCPAQLIATTDQSGFTPLHLAARHGHEAAARTLLAAMPYPALLLALAN